MIWLAAMTIPPAGRCRDQAASRTLEAAPSHEERRPAVKQVRTHRRRIRREHPCLEVLPVDPRDPDIVKAKALARALPTDSSRGG